MQMFCLFRRQSSQLAAAQRLHYPNGNAEIAEPLDLGFRVLKMPIDIVQLHLSEFHAFAVCIQKTLHDVIAAMDGKAEVPNASVCLLPEQVIIDSVLRVQVCADVHFAYIVEEIKVEILHAAALQLFFKNFLYFGYVCQIITGEFIGKIERIPRIGTQRISHHDLRAAVVIPVSRVKIIDAMFDGVCDHFFHSGYVDVGENAVDNRQTHRAHTECG